MSITSEPSPFNEGDFRAIETAVLETEKGRWFLHEFGRRNRVADTQTLLDALSRLERNLTSQMITPLADQPDIAALSSAIEATRADISSVRNDMLKEQAEIPAGKAVFSHLSENARQIAVDMIATAEALQGTIASLRKAPGDASHADAIDGHVQSLFDGGWRQDVLAQRISKAMALLEHIDQNLKTLAAGAKDNQARPATPQEVNKAVEVPLKAENLKYFAGDNEMFAPNPGKQTEPPKLNLAVLSDEPAKTPSQYPRFGDAATNENDPEISKTSKAPAALKPVEQISAAAQTGAPAKQETIAPVQPASPSLEPPIEPNIVIIRRGKNATEAAADTAPAKAESDTELAPVTPSSSDIKSPEAAPVNRPDATTLVAKSEEATPETRSENAKWTRSDTPDKDKETPTSHSKSEPSDSKSEPSHSMSDALSAFGDIAAAEPVIPDVATAAAKTPDIAATKPKTPDTASDAAPRAAPRAAPHAAKTADTPSKPMNPFEAFAAASAEKVRATERASSDDDVDAPNKSTEPEDDEDRIVVIRRNSSEESEIPFADYLGVEAQTSS